MTPRVSILIPAYNAGAWISEALRSAVGQTWANKEIIVVDDGSTDQTRAIADSFKPSGVVVVSQRNQGASAARNRALSMAQGDYIQWLDADDLLARDKIERQLAAVEDAPRRRILLSGAWGSFRYRVDRTEFVPTALWTDLAPVEWLLLKMANNLSIQPDAWLVSRELTEAAGPWNERLFRDNDGEYFSRVVRACEFVKFVPRAKSYYRFAGFSSISHIGRSNKKLDSLFLSLQLHIRYLRSLEDSVRTRAACVQYLQIWQIEFYPFRMDLVRQLESLANSLGGQLSAPRLSWKYDWIRATCGWRAAKESQMLYNRLKGNLIVGCDNLLSHVQRGSRSDLA